MAQQLDPEKEAEADARAAHVGAQWGHPGERWDALIARIQNTSVTEFTAISDEWLDLMWCLDQYRIADAPPAGMGKAHLRFSSRIDGIYRARATGSRRS